MAEWTLKYADARGEIHQQTAEAGSERELRDRYTQQGFLVYSIKPRSEIAGLVEKPSRKKKLHLEKFLIFNQQFVTLIRAGLPILKSLDLLAERLTDPKLSVYIKGVREEVRNGALLSDAFAKQGVFPPIYVTTVLAGERSGALAEVIERFITYQKLSLSVRKKLLVSLMYPAVLITLVVALIVFLVTYVVPNFAQLYSSMDAQLPLPTQILIAVGTTARNYVVLGFTVIVAGIFGFRYWSRTPRGSEIRRPVSAEDAGVGRSLAEVSGGAVLASVGDSSDRRNSAAASARYRSRFAGHAGAETRAATGRQDGARRAGSFAIAAADQNFSRAFDRHD